MTLAVLQVCARRVVLGIICIKALVEAPAQQRLIFRAQFVRHVQAIVMYAVLQVYAQRVALGINYIKTNAILVVL